MTRSEIRRGTDGGVEWRRMPIATKAGGGAAATGFSVPSFAAGLAVGAIAAVAAVYLFGPGAGNAEAPVEAPLATVGDAPEFEFWERLPNARVAPATAPYETGGTMRPEPEGPVEYLLQAGAFHRAGAAERRRAELILAGDAGQHVDRGRRRRRAVSGGRRPLRDAVGNADRDAAIARPGNRSRPARKTGAGRLIPRPADPVR